MPMYAATGLGAEAAASSAEATTSITCPVCAEDRAAADFPPVAIAVGRCTHPLTDICRACVATHTSTCSSALTASPSPT